MKQLQKYHDFIEVATEAIVEHQNHEKSVPSLTREDIDEIVIAQVKLHIFLHFR